MQLDLFKTGPRLALLSRDKGVSRLKRKKKLVDLLCCAYTIGLSYRTRKKRYKS